MAMTQCNGKVQCPIIANVEGMVVKISRSFVWITPTADEHKASKSFSVMSRDVLFYNGANYHDLNDSPLIPGESLVRMNLIDLGTSKAVLTVWEKDCKMPKIEDEEVKAKVYRDALNKQGDEPLSSEPLNGDRHTPSNQLSARSIPNPIEDLRRHLLPI